MEEPGEHWFSLGIEIGIPATQETSVPDLCTASLPGNSAEDTKFESNHEETSDKPELEDIFQNNWPMVHNTSRPKGLGKCLRLKEIEEK